MDRVRSAPATVWARWRPEPGDEAGGMPLSLRWIPALTLGIASAAVVWLMMPPGQPELQMALGAAAAFGVTVACALWLGRTGERAVRAAQEESFWRLNAEAVTAHMRHLFLREEVMAYAAQTIMEELHATRLHVYLLNNHNFELAASLPSKPEQVEVFSKRGLTAVAFCPNHRVPFVDYIDPRTGTPVRWAYALPGTSAYDMQSEQKRLEAMGAEAGVAAARRGPGRDGGRRPASHAGHARARRQIPVPGLCRRAAGRHCPAYRLGQVPERGPDLRGPRFRLRGSPR